RSLRDWSSDVCSSDLTCPGCPSRTTWPTPSPWLCATTTRNGCRPRRTGGSPVPQRRPTMITRITGVLNRVLDDEVRLQVGALERSEEHTSELQSRREL